MLDLTAYGEKWLERLQVLNYAKRTIEESRFYLFKFFRFLGEMGVPDIEQRGQANI
jgi:hypothetical protein